MMTTSSFPNSDSNNSQHTHSNTITDTRLSMQQDTIPTFSSKKSENKAPVENELEEKESEYQMIAKVPSEESREDSDQESLSLRQDTINDQESEQVPVIDERKTRLSTTGSRKKINQDNHDSSSQSSIDTEDQDENLSIASIPRQSTRPRRSSIPRQPSTQDIVDTKTEGPSSSSGRKITLRHSKRRGSLSSLNSTSTSTAPGPKTLVTDGRTSQQLKKKINGKQPPNTIDLGKLDVSSLKKYRRAYKLRIKPGSTRLQLLQAIQDHHQDTKVDEFDVVSRFLDRVKSEDSRTSSMNQGISPGRISLNGKVLGLHSSQSGK